MLKARQGRVCDHSAHKDMASLSVVLFQILYPFAAILLYVFLQKLNEERKQKARNELQLKLDRQKEQQPEVQYRGDSATDSVGALPENSRVKDSAARYNGQQQQPTLPQSVFKPEPTMLELPSLPHDWEVQPEQLVISKRPDGSPWELGTGAFGKVSCCRANLVPSSQSWAMYDSSCCRYSRVF